MNKFFNWCKRSAKAVWQNPGRVVACIIIGIILASLFVFIAPVAFAVIAWVWQQMHSLLFWILVGYLAAETWRYGHKWEREDDEKAATEDNRVLNPQALERLRKSGVCLDARGNFVAIKKESV
jgi:hypothetical protein